MPSVEDLLHTLKKAVALLADVAHKLTQSIDCYGATNCTVV